MLALCFYVTLLGNAQLRDCLCQGIPNFQNFILRRNECSDSIQNPTQARGKIVNQHWGLRVDLVNRFFGLHTPVLRVQ
jgi:hypothetical protein